ncbi:hypothetical protein JYT35_01115 [Acidimicrobium ferrooxidans]|uniref:Uncharacterized protein n=1 Tax=Acidimicrobium ferrooxidans TaxID=53635 RepID=A0ABS3APS3_9ACTN|nr:hypothetical protein [Acidimicrobium ferrooxidans]
MVLTVLVIVLVSTFRSSQTSFIGYLSMFPTYLSAPTLRTRAGQIVFLSLVVIVVIWSTSTASSDLWPLFFWVPVPAAAFAIRAIERRRLH